MPEGVLTRGLVLLTGERSGPQLPTLRLLVQPPYAQLHQSCCWGGQRGWRLHAAGAQG